MSAIPRELNNKRDALENRLQSSPRGIVADLSVKSEDPLGAISDDYAYLVRKPADYELKLPRSSNISNVRVFIPAACLPHKAAPHNGNKVPTARAPPARQVKTLSDASGISSFEVKPDENGRVDPMRCL